jgi:hypothetical protein
VANSHNLDVALIELAAAYFQAEARSFAVEAIGRVVVTSVRLEAFD